MLRYRLRKYGILSCLVFLCGFLVFDGCTHDSSEEYVKIIQPCGSGNFDVSSGSLGTSAKGTVLIYEKEKSVRKVYLA